MARSIIIPLIVLILSGGVLMNGCQKHTRLPSESEERLIQQHSGVIVLFHLRAVPDGGPPEDIRIWDRDERAGSFGVTVDIGKLEPGQSSDSTLKILSTERISPARISPSGPGGKRGGWIYHVLPPGRYYLTLYDMEKKRSLAPGFILSVSGEQKLVYAGTLDISCKPRPFGCGTVVQCSGVSLTDEGVASQGLAQAHLSQYGPLSISLVSKYNETVAASPGQGRLSKHEVAEAASKRQAIFPMGYCSTSTRDVVSPSLVKESVKRATGIGTWMEPETIQGFVAASQITWGASLVPIMAYVAYLPGAAAVGAIVGKSAEKKWQPCLQELVREIGEIDPASALQRKLSEELDRFRDAKTMGLPPGDPTQTATQRGLKSFLQAAIQRIEIKECQERRSFCLQVSLRAQLWKLPEKTSVYDKVLVYTSSLTPKLQPSEVMVLGPSPCRRMEDYCGAQGKQLFREEIAAAIDSLVKRLSLEMGL
jgi:hypothetical protein